MPILAKCETKCACGSGIEFHARKPSFLQSTVAKARCHECQSYYLFSCRMEAGNKKRVTFNTSILELSVKLRELLKAKKEANVGAG